MLFESSQLLEDAHQCGYPHAKANLVAACAPVKNQLGKITSWTQQKNIKRAADSGSHVSQGFTRRHSGLRRDPCRSTKKKSAEAERVRRRRVKIEEALRAAKVAKPLAKWLTIGIDDVTAQAPSSDVPQWDDTTDFTSAFSFFVADASGAGPVGILFNDVFATPKEKSERKLTNLVAKMTKSAGMTRLQLADNEPFKLDAAKFPRWCADGSCGEIAHKPFLLAISPMTLGWGATFYPCPGLDASLVALRGRLFVCCTWTP